MSSRLLQNRARQLRKLWKHRPTRLWRKAHVRRCAASVGMTIAEYRRMDDYDG